MTSFDQDVDAAAPAGDLVERFADTVGSTHVASERDGWLPQLGCYSLDRAKPSTQQDHCLTVCRKTASKLAAEPRTGPGDHNNLCHEAPPLLFLTACLTEGTPFPLRIFLVTA